MQVKRSTIQEIMSKITPLGYAKLFVFMALSILMISPALISSTQGAVRYSDENLYKLFPSTTRQIIELSGNWDKSIDENTWTTVSLPFTDDNKERVVFKKNLNIDPSMVKKYSWSLHFLGINEQVEVYLNNQLLGKYFGAMTPFNVNIHQNLITGRQNVLQLVVTPADNYSELIKNKNIYFKQNSIGVLREIFLVGTPQIWIKDISYRTNVNSDFTSASIQSKVNISSGQLAGLNVLSNDSVKKQLAGRTAVSVQASLYSSGDNLLIADAPAQDITMENERSSVMNFNFNISNPNLWSPESPKLYYIKVKVLSNGAVLDEYSQSLGIRTVKSIDKNGASGAVTLNGKPFVIKGIDYVEDHYASGASLSPYRMEQDIILMKTLGVNLIRFKYSVPHPYLAYLCDKYGMMFTVDVPLYNVPSNFFDIYEIKSRMKNLVERITANYNAYPSTFGYCISEGLIEGSSSDNVLEELTHRFKSNTDKLLIKSVLLGSQHFSTSKIDIINVVDNRKYLPYEVLNNQIRSIVSKANGKPITINFGFPIQINNSNGYSDPLSIEAQRNYMLHNANLVNNNSLAGLIFWAFNDYAINNPLLTVNNPEQNVATVGLFNRGRQQRLSYSTLQAIYTSQEEQPLLTAGSYTESVPLVYIVGVLLLIIVLFTFTQRFKRFREYLMRSLLRPYNFYADIRDQRIISIGQTFLLALMVALSLGLYLSAILYYLRTSDIAQQVIMSFVPFDSLLPGLFKFIWQPIWMSLIIASLYLLKVFVLAGIIRIISLFVKSRIYYTDTLTIVVWSSVPLLILLPFSLFIIKMLFLFPYLTLAVLILTAILFIWVIFRMIKSTTVVFDIRPIIAYSVGGAIIVMFLTAYIMFLNSSNSIFSYMNYISQYLLNT